MPPKAKKITRDFGEPPEPYTKAQWYASCNRIDSTIDKEARDVFDRKDSKDPKNPLMEIGLFKSRYKAKSIKDGKHQERAIEKDRKDADENGLCVKDFLEWIDQGRPKDLETFKKEIEEKERSLWKEGEEEWLSSLV